jgi:hypothetical protein
MLRGHDDAWAAIRWVNTCASQETIPDNVI